MKNFYEVRIDRLDHNGRGISKISDKIVFVDNALPDEIVKIEIVKEKKKFYEAKVDEYVSVSKDRIEIICPYYNECGGCNLLHISYDNQLSFKENKVKDIMKRYAGIEENIVKNIIGSDNVFKYRNKVTFQVNNELGFFKENTNDIISVDRCLLISEKMNDILKVLKENLNLDSVKQVVVKDMDNCQVMLIIYLHHDMDLDYLIDLLGCKVDSIVKISGDDCRVLKGESNIIAKLNNLSFFVSSTSFFQVNLGQTVKLYDKIKEYCDLKKSDKVLDLYCGTGTIGLYLSDSCDKVLGVEINKEAIGDANKNKELNNIANVEFMSMDSKDVISKINLKPDVVVVDPPRVGLDSKVVTDIIKIKPRKIVYVSCDPITLARDLKLFSTNYDIAEITPVDMFPNTYHVETVTLLVLKK